MLNYPEVVGLNPAGDGLLSLSPSFSSFPKPGQLRSSIINNIVKKLLEIAYLAVLPGAKQPV